MLPVIKMSHILLKELQDNSSNGKLSGISDINLKDYVSIVGAFYFDLKNELEKRNEE